MTESYGFTIEDINNSCPNDLKPYVDAHNLKAKMRDEEMWLQGRYNMEAFAVIMSHFGAGTGKKKSNAKYLEKPFTHLVEDKDRELTPEEIDAELRKMIYNEELWIEGLKEKGLPEMVIK